jgi:hypothetical protein
VSSTTTVVARDLAARMDFDSGQVRYCLDSMVERLGLSRATISRHVAYLREMGSLAWVQHGSRANARRAGGRAGYARTATVYGAVIPPGYDDALGLRRVGSGYTARIIVDLRTQPESVDNLPADQRSSGACETPSLTLVKEVGQVQVEGGEEASTAQTRTARIITRRPKRKLTILGYKITAERVERARQLAVSVRPLVNWIQGASHRQLSWVLLDMTAKGWSEGQIVMWLERLGQEIGVRRWRPRFPHRVIAAAMRRQDQAETRQALADSPDPRAALRESTGPNRAFQQARQSLRSLPSQRSAEEYPQLEDVPQDAWDLVVLREAAAGEPGLVRACVRLCGRDEAVRIYGTAAIAAADAALEDARAGLRRLAV